MCKTKNPSNRREASSIFFLPAVARCLLGITFAALVLACATLRAEDVDDQYVNILTLVQQGDVLKNSGNTAAALAKYRAAEAGLNDFRKAHADWNAKIVNYRWNVVAQKIADLTGGAAAAADAGSTSGTETRPAQTTGKTTSGTAGHAAKLLEAGAEPRKVLRYHPKAGDKQTIQMTMKMGIDMGGAMPAMKFPPIIMTIDTTVKDVASSGEISYETVITDATMGEEEGANPQMAAVMKTQVSGIKGHTITGSMSDRGVNKKGNQPEASAKGGDMASQIGEGVSDLSAAELPEEAIGVGAKWEVRKSANSKGMTATDITTYQLVSIEGDRLTAKATMTETAPKQKISNPMMPGAKVDLTKMTGTGSAEMSFDLGQLMPTTGKMEMHNEMQMSTAVGNQKQAMTMKTDANLTVESK